MGWASSDGEVVWHIQKQVAASLHSTGSARKRRGKVIE